MAYICYILSGLFLLAALHPFLTYPLTLRVLRRMRPAKQTLVPPFHPSVALCVCAYNEEGVIGDKAENLLALQKAYPGLDVLVYVDAASDKTAEILRRYESNFFVHVSPDRHGKTHGMNLLVAKAQAEIVVFTDANVMLDVESFIRLPEYFSDARVGCVCGHLRYTNAGASVTAANGSLYWRLEEHIKQLESDTGSLMGADGSLFAIRRALHRAPPDDIIDDMFVSFSILCEGYRIVRAGDVTAWEKSVTSSKEEFRRKVRISCQAFNVHRLLWPRLRKLGALDRYKYVSHKFMRWLVVYWLAGAAVCFEAGLIASGHGWAGAVTGLAGLTAFIGAAALKFGPALQVSDILTAFAGTGLGVWRSLKGARFQTWSPAASIRAEKQ